MRPPRRPCRQHFPDEAIGLFKCINEAESHICTGFVCVILDRKGDILPRFGARYDRFCSHDPARCVTRSRRPWKYPASTGAVGVEMSPSKIGKGSWRERGCQYGETSVVAVSLKKK